MPPTSAATNSIDHDAARATLRRTADASLNAEDLAAEIEYWNRQRALWLGDLAARDFRDCDESAQLGGIAYAEQRLRELRRHAERHLRARSIPGYPTPALHEDLTARFQAAKWCGLVDLAQTLTGQAAIKTGNGRFRLPCPFHEGDREPSLVIYPPGKGWHCFGCRKGGDAVAFCAEFFHCGAVTALWMVEQLAETYPEAWGAAS